MASGAVSRKATSSSTSRSYSSTSAGNLDNNLGKTAFRYKYCVWRCCRAALFFDLSHLRIRVWYTFGLLGDEVMGSLGLCNDGEG